ncbi:39S ribosomal protein L52, mitochondrial [Leptopilina heterotoma]|uniref:39S ribosomal protein L52, mitochondrial n=1 Tax=Leptopilina heterotoma TaxID=63436 RepID=UPI001CA9E8CA|nr:39S ribosomal protein L52, mitochondrial [Leptopilina heterotoma]
MALLKNITHCMRIETKILVNGFKTSSVPCIDQKWRKQRGLTLNPNRFGPLTNLPDYSFKDGRTVPLGVNQSKRLNKNREYAEKIVKLVGEVDYAVERYYRLIEEKKQERDEILRNKLKPKGQLLLNKNDS